MARVTTNYYCPQCGRITWSHDRKHECGNITKAKPPRCPECGHKHHWWYDEDDVWVCHHCGYRPATTKGER